MKTVKPWVNALRIPDANYTQWSQEAPSSLSLTFWCLTTGKVSLPLYLQWARNYYGLPSLKSEYFERLPESKFWQAIAGVANWSEELIPLLQWDGVVYIACVEPLDVSAWSFPVQFVLAEPQDLQTYWQRLTSMQPAPVNPEQEPQNFAAETADAPVSSRSPDWDPEATQGLAPKPEEMPVAEAPEGFEMVGAEGLPSEAPQGLSFTEPAGLESDAPQGLSVAAPEGMDVPQGLTFDGPAGLSGIEASHEPGAHPEAQATTAMAGPEDVPEGLSSSPETSHVAPEAAKSTEPVPTSEPAAATAPAGPAAPPAFDDPARVTPKEMAFEAIQNELDAVAWLFAELKKTFKSCMTLFFAMEEFKIWKHDGTLSPVSSDIPARAINTSKPSVFRILKRTGLPYHGPLAASPVNEEFFKNWGLSELPPHLTLLPLLAEKRLVGGVLCIGDPSCNTQEILTKSEALVEQFCQVYFRLNKSQAA